MPKFIVTVTAKVNMITHVTVDAANPDEAEMMAIKEASDDISGHDWEFPDSGGPDIEDGDIEPTTIVYDENGEEVSRPDPIAGLIQIWKDNDLDEDFLDEAVSESKSNDAANINNAGIEAQMRYLIELFGVDYVRELIS